MRRPIKPSWRGALPGVVLAGGVALHAGTAAGADAPAAAAAAAPVVQPQAAAASAAVSCTAKRPTVLFNRWQEDWSVLANPCVPRKPFDALKYVPLGDDPSTYLSLGANLRERFELNNAPLFGLGSAHDDNYVIQRTNVHADLRYRGHLQAFVQFVDARPFGKNTVGPVDKDQLDIEQAFVAYVDQIGPGTLKTRVGRQEMAFDLQRFVSVRDGPNVRQAFDALGRLRNRQVAADRLRDAPGAVSRRRRVRRRVEPAPAIRRRARRAQRHGPGDLSAYWSRYTRDNARFPDASGTERRDVFDMRYAGKADGRLGRRGDAADGPRRAGHGGRVGVRRVGRLYVREDGRHAAHRDPSTARRAMLTRATGAWVRSTRCFRTAITSRSPVIPDTAT